MSYLGIMSRGYICPIGTKQVLDIGQPPTITDAQILTPIIAGSTIPGYPAPRPTITGGQGVTPTVRGAVDDSSSTTTEAPVVSGTVLAPTITSAEED